MLKFFLSYRFVIILVGWVYVTTIPGLAFGTLSFAMTCMVKSNATANKSGQCTSDSFDWSKDLQATLFAGYSYGAIVVILFVGWLVDKLGPKRVMIVSSTLALISVALLPVGAQKGGDWKAVLVLRITLGMAASPSWPVVARVASVWVHPSEKGTALGIGSTGFATGTFLANIVSGYLCCWKGWQSVFYFAAIAIAVNLVLILVFFSSNPKESWWLSKTELEYIERGQEGDSHASYVIKKTPVLAILTSLPVLTVFINGYGERTIQFFTLMFLPTYLKEGLGVTTKQNGILSAIPELFQIVGRGASGIISDKIKFSRNPTVNAKIYNTFAFLVVIAMLIANVFIKPGQESLVTIYMCIQFFFGSLVLAGYLRAAVMIAPRFAGTIMAFSTFGAFLAAIVLPYYVEALTPAAATSEESLKHWHNVFYVILAIVIFAMLTFLIFGTTAIQKWAQQSQLPTTAVAPKRSAVLSASSSSSSSSMSQDVDEDGVVMKF